MVKDNVKTAVETFYQVHKAAERDGDIPDLSPNQCVARLQITWDATNGRGGEGQAYAAVHNLYSAMADALKDRIQVQWEPDAYGSIGTLRAYIFTPVELRAVIEAAYRMGFDGRSLNPWALRKLTDIKPQANEI